MFFSKYIKLRFVVNIGRNTLSLMDFRELVTLVYVIVVERSPFKFVVCIDWRKADMIVHKVLLASAK